MPTRLSSGPATTSLADGGREAARSGAGSADLLFWIAAALAAGVVVALSALVQAFA